MARNVRIIGAIAPRRSDDYQPSPEYEELKRKVAAFKADTSGGSSLAPWPWRSSESERDDDDE